METYYHTLRPTVQGIIVLYLFSKQATSRKSAMLSYHISHVAAFGWLSDQDHALAYFRDQFISTIMWNWTPLEECVTNIICVRFMGCKHGKVDNS